MDRGDSLYKPFAIWEKLVPQRTPAPEATGDEGTTKPAFLTATRTRSSVKKGYTLRLSSRPQFLDIYSAPQHLVSSLPYGTGPVGH